VALATSSPPGHPDRFGQEDVWAYEVGAKTEWLDNALRLNVSAYHYDYEDLHTNATDAIGFAKVVPAPKAEIDGVELDAVWSVTPRLLLSASAAYVDAQYDSILTYPDGLGGTKVDDLKGNRLPRSPKSELSLGFEYSQPILDGNVSLRVDWRFSDSAYLTELNDPIDEQRSYNTGNIRIRYTPASDQFDLEAFVDNVADEQVRSHSKPILGAVYRGMVTPPRVAGVEFRFRL
jgi:iron complex outermembrane receptor protein